MNEPADRRRRVGVLASVGPGLLVAATGVGAGDLATGGFAGSKLGMAVLWAVAVGALLKYVLNEGLARWQLATGETLLAGAIRRLGRPVSVIFILYLLPWSFFVGAALISACGVTTQALLPFFDDPAQGKMIYGAALSLVGVVVAWKSGFRVFEKVMAGCIAVMFLAVIVTALLMRPDPREILSGLFIPRIPQLNSGGLTWIIALMGGVGGTLTILCYGYWIREQGRTSVRDLRLCRLDLAVGYTATGLFGMAMIVIASGLQLDGSGASLVVGLADQLDDRVGPLGRWVFLVGAWAAVFSSLLGVWQAVPYLFTDFWRMRKVRRGDDQPPASQPLPTDSLPYRLFLLGLAAIPLLQVGHPFREVQKYYAVLGAAFVPMLAVVLLILGGRGRWIGLQYRNHPVTTFLLGAALLLTVVAGIYQVRSAWG